MDNDQSVATEREQRMLAVAKLKRAASLPRLKDGRRPPMAMHTEAVSEGEKGAIDEPDVDTPPERQIDLSLEAEEREGEVVENEQEIEDLTVTPPPVRSKRRSRSRSRSRGSRDFKGKARALHSPTPNQGDSSQDEAFTPSPAPITIPVLPQLISPIPSHLHHPMLLRSPTPNSDPRFPASPSPSTTPLPTLEDIQKGLFRSNSVGRMMAMHKLTGGTETYEPSPSPTPPISSKFRRNNTISGGERSAARKKLMDTLGSRAKATAVNNAAEHEQVSGNDEPTAPSPSPTPRRRRRRSRRGSSSGVATAATGVSDSEFPSNSTSTNTPQVPPTPLPPSSLDFYPDLRARSVTPNQASSRAHSPRGPSPLVPYEIPPTPPPLPTSPLPEPPVNENGTNLTERPERARRRSVVVEEEYEEQSPTRSNAPPLPSTPPMQFVSNGYYLRAPHSSDTPSDLSNDPTTSSAIGVPFYLSQRAPSREDGFPNSPFGTPLKERPSREEDDEEKVLYSADTLRDRSDYDEYDREISWVAEPVPEVRMPIHDDDDEAFDEDYEDEQDYEERNISPQSLHEFSNPDAYDDGSARASSDSQNLVIETSPATTPSHIPPSPSSVAALSGSASIPRESDGSASPPSYPARLSVVLPSERSPMSADFGDFDDRPITTDASSKQSADSATTSTWEKLKNTFRSNSSLGRRSRSNSIVNRRDHTDSSISRESGASLTSPRLDKVDSTSTFATQQGQPPMLSPSASNSMLSVSPTPGSRSGASPVPPASSVDMSKYQNAKLFPFPGMKRLEEERNRAKGLHSASASTPDVNAFFSSSEDGSASQQAPHTANPLLQTPNSPPPRPLIQQNSDSNLVGRYMAPPLASAHSSQSSHPEYFDITPSPSNVKLPMTLPGVKQWLSKNKKLFSSQGSSPTSPALSPPTIENGVTVKKPSLTDLLRFRKDNDLVTELEELSHTPTDTSGNTVVGRPQRVEARDHLVPVTPPAASPIPTSRGEILEVERTPKAPRNFTTPVVRDDDFRLSTHKSPPMPSPPDATSSTTVDPLSSISDYPAQSTSDSSSNSSSNYNLGEFPGPMGSLVLQQLDEQIRSRWLRSPAWAAAIDDPQRKLVLSSPVLQVVNANTVKDRFLFLFTDILVIAKPVLHDEDALFDRPTPERKFIVKNVVHLQHLRVAGDRNESQNRSSGVTAVSRNPILRAFVHNFSKDPDHAISTLFSRTGLSDDPVFLGQLLFRTIELDRVQLGSYLSQRTSKVVLKSYLDSFGFMGLRVDRALRIFLLSLHVPPRHINNHALEYLLDAFASRWYEANARFIAYDKDLAIRLVRGLNQLNDHIHGGLWSEPYILAPRKRNISSREFKDAFRRCDPKYTVSDEFLEDIYESVRDERLWHASDVPTDAAITIKRPLPPRLTYKVQSEPVVFRIPQPDPNFTIHLHGQDLTIDPPVLTFAKSSEATFRVTGTSLGPKTLILCRSGLNALKYSGLPLAQRITIERAFMRNTFQVAFMNHCGNKRRYMFSVDDPLVRHQWLISLRRHVDNATSTSTSLMAISPGPSRFYRAAEIVAFKVLQETLIGQALSSGPSRVVDEAIQRLNNDGLNGSPRGRVNGSFAPLHMRSKSRSKVYHRSKAGKNELDIGLNGSDIHDSPGAPASPGSSNHQPSTNSDSPTWSGQDLVTQCQSNSSIALVLSFLQVGSPEQGSRPTS